MQGKNAFLVCVCLIVILCYFVEDGSEKCYAQRRGTDLTARKFDEFTLNPSLPDEEEAVRPRLVRFVMQLRAEPGSRAYIIAYGGRLVRFRSPEAAVRMEGIRNRLTDLGFPYQRVITVNGGFRESATTELWILPRGARPPQASPTIQPSEVAYCPFIRVVGRPYISQPGRQLVFAAEISYGDENIRPEFNWRISHGTIIEGQGTTTITVELPSGIYPRVVAAVDVNGYALECPNTESAMTAVGVDYFKLDEFGDIQCEDELARLDNLAIHLQEEPELKTFIIIYGGRSSWRNQAQGRAERMRNYLVNSRGISTERVTVIDGGHRDTLTGEFWLAPLGGRMPTPTPTVDPRYVRFIRRRTGTIAAHALCNFG